MKRKFIKEVIRNFINNGFIGKRKNSLLNYSFVMIDIIHKILVLLKNPLNILKTIFVQKFFSYHIIMKNLRPKEEKITKDIRNLFRLKKN